MLISIVSPVYKSEAIINELTDRIQKVMSHLAIDYEVILVDDGSPDDSWTRISELCVSNRRIRAIKLSRNFGQHNAVTAGLSASGGDITVVMDCDLQDDPANIARLYEEFKKGNEIVFTRRIKRKHPWQKRMFANIYNLFFGLFSERDYDVNVGSMVMFSSAVRRSVLRLQDKDRLYIQMLKWVGFKSTYVAVEHNNRYHGKSTYSNFKLLQLAILGWTSYSNKMLRFSVYGGFFLSFLTFIISLVILIRYFTSGFMPGWPSLFIAIMFSTGLILMSIGVAGIYIGKIFEQAKNRPLYIIDKTINCDEENSSHTI